MNTILFKRKLCALYEIIREQKQQTYLNPEFIWLMYTGARFGLILREDKFNYKEYQDEELILVKNFINWFNLITPISQIQLSNFQSLIVLFIAAFHIIPILIILFGSKQSNILKQFLNLYFTYFQILILYPSIIHMHYLQYQKPNPILYWPCTTLIFVNYLIFSYFQRNYLLPIQNPFMKRYKIKNYIQNLIEILVLINIPYFEEIIQSMILMILFLIQLIDAIFNQPYLMDINIDYCFCTSILLFGSGIKSLSLYMNQKQYVYYSLMLIPLLSLFMKRVLILTYDANIEQSQLSKNLLFQIADEFYCRNPLIQSKILFILKNKHKIMENKQPTQHQQNNYILILLLRLNDQYWQQKKSIDEELQLYKLFFLFQTQEKLNLAYIEMKKYKISSSTQSLYFQICETYCSKQIIQKINQNSKFLQGKLEIQQIKQSHILIERCIPLIIEVLDLKNKFWEQLLKGYDKLEQLALKCIKISDKIQNLKNLVFVDLGIDIFLINKQIMKLNILDLRLLSLVFGSILNDYYITFDIEQRIDDLLSQESNVLSRNVQNISLLNDDVIIISISMMKNQGQILNKNKTNILKYFKFPNDISFQSICQLNQLIPEYLVDEHDKFLNKFLNTGESDLFNTSHDVFPNYYTGFSFLVTLQLFPSYEEMDDYVLSAILKKNFEHSDFIIFDQSGRILGLSEYVLELLIQDDSQQFNKAILNSYIYFWFKDLLVIINQQIESMTNYSQQLTLFSQTTSIQQITNLSELIKFHDQYYKKYVYLEFNSQKTEQDQKKGNQQSIKPSCFEIDYVIQMFDFVNQHIQKFTQNKNGFQVGFNIQFQKLQGVHPLFILQITEFTQKELKFINPKSIGTISAYSSISKIKSQLKQSDLNSLSDFDMDELHQDFFINQTIINKLVLRQEQKEIQDVIQNVEETKNIKVMIDKENKESNLISPRSNREIQLQKGLIEDDSEEIQGNESKFIKSSSQRENIELDEFKNQQIEFQLEKQSRSSATSNNTQNSIHHLIRKLQYKIKFQRGIVKAIINTIFLSIFLIILISIELSVEKNNMDELKFSIPLVRLPQRFNRLYCTFIAIGQLQLQNKLLNQSYGQYYDYRIKNESIQKRSEISDLMLDIKNQFSQMQQNNQVPPMSIRILNEYIFLQENSTMLQFDNLVNEFTFQINEYLQIKNQTQQESFKIIALLEFLKGNLIAQVNITINIVNQIEQDFFDLIEFSQIEQLIFLTVMLWVIIIFLILQLNHWQQPYKYMQVILLLISKISEKDIELTISKTLYLIERIVNNPQNIKNINYFKDCFLINQKLFLTFQSARISEMHKSNQSGKIVQQKPKKSSRIQETSLSILNIKIILLFFWLILSGLTVSAYIIMNKNIKDSQPELRLTMEFVKFKQNLDGIMIICYLLKSQQSLIEQTLQVFSQNSELRTEDRYFSTQYQELLEVFNPLLIEMDGIYSNIYNDVVESSKINDYNKNRLLNLFEKDLCEIIPSILPFCAYENGTFQYFPTYPSAESQLNNNQIYKYGINGIYQQIISIFNIYYILEKNGIKDTNLTNTNLFLESTEFIQIILPYFFDLSYAILEFYYTMIYSSLDILQNDYQMILQFYVSTGIGCLIILYIVCLIRSFTLQRKVQLILQSIILIPYESLQDQSILMSLKKIDRSL
ncbi:unnamed protein product [Paramecium sonneborni]|uniref:Transmembrane protein n=1 Tax=Paramecium sonneborni TaxID=65129 RepID=A0A8S1PW26_9CILI|nr:unnamed protein product [Paramecium sonneborni]